MRFLREHLVPEDIRIIADDYGERSGHEGSLYDQLVDRAGVQQAVRVLVLHAVARKDVMGLVLLIAEHYPALQETLRSLGFETTELTRSYLAALQQEIKYTKEQETQPDMRYFTTQTATSLPIQQDQPLDFTLLLQDTAEPARQTAFTKVDSDDLFTIHQYIILSHSEQATTVSVLHSLALHMIEDWQHAPADAVIPVLLPLEKWFNPTLDLRQFLQMHMTWLGIPQFAEVLPDLLHAGRVILLLEGLDTLPFVKYNELTGLLDDTRVLSIAQLSEERQWRNVRCVLSCQVKKEIFGPRWREVYILDPTREQQPWLSDNPALTLKNSVDSVFEKASTVGQLPDGIAASELQTCLGRLALNVTYAEYSLRSKRSLSKNEPASVDIQTAATWLFHLQELNNFEMEPELKVSQEELQLTEQLFHWAEAIGLLARGKHWLYSSDEPRIYFPDEHIQNYLCLHYCLSHMQETPQLVDLLRLASARKVWWLWRTYDLDLMDKLLLLSRSSDKETRSDATWILRWCSDSRVIEPLMALCNDTDARVRRGAAFALGDLHDHRAMEPLLHLLRDTDDNVRLSAVHALSTFDDERVMPSLMQVLDDANEDVGYAVILALEEIGDARAVPALISALSDKREASYAAKDTLAKLGKAAVPALIEALARTTNNFVKSYGNTTSFEEENNRTIYDIVETLGKIGDIRPLPMLMWMAEYDYRETPVGKVRHAAEQATQEIQKRHRLAAPLLAALHSQKRNIHIGAMFALGLLNDNRAVEPLLVALQDLNVYIRWGVARLLGNIADQRAVMPLIATMRENENEVRQSALAALRKFGASTVTLLIPLLGDTDSNVRFSTVRLLGEIRNGEAVEALIVALSDPNDWVREAAVVALGSIGDRRALEPLLTATRDPSAAVRNSVGGAINKIDPEQSIRVFLTLLQDNNNDVRHNAARDLIQYGNSQAVEPLIAALKDPYDNVREYAAYALKRHGDSRAVEPLIELLQNEDGLDARAAAGALAALGDQRAIVPIITTLAKSEENYCASLAGALLLFGEAITQPLINALEDKGSSDPIYSQEFWQQSLWDVEYRRESYPHYYTADLHYYAADLLGNVGDVRALPVLVWMEAKDYSITRKEKSAREGEALWQELMQEAGTKVDSISREEKSARVAAAQAINAILQRNPSRDTLAALLDSQNEAIHLGAAFALGKYHDQGAIPGLIEALKHNDRRIRWGAVRLLDRFGSYRKIAPLIMVLEDEDTDVLSMTASALSRAGKTAIHPLIAALADEDRHNRDWIARVLIWMGKPSVPFLLAALHNKHSDYDWIAYTLGKIGKPAVRSLIAALRDKQIHVCYWAASVLGSIGDGRATKPLTALLNGGNIVARVGAATALATMGNTRASEQLIAFLKHKKPIVRFGAINNLSEIEHLRSRATKLIIAALTDEVKDVCLAAIAALGYMGDYQALEALQLIAGIRSFPETTLTDVDEPDLLLEDFNVAQAIRHAAQEDTYEPDLLLEDFFPTQAVPSTPSSLTEDADLDADALPPLPPVDPHRDAFLPVEGPTSALPESDVIWWGQSTNLDTTTPQEAALQGSDIPQVLAELAEAIKQKPETYLLDKDIQDTTREAIKRMETRGIKRY